jgi:hypothetical protein
MNIKKIEIEGSSLGYVSNIETMYEIRLQKQFLRR